MKKENPVVKYVSGALDPKVSKALIEKGRSQKGLVGAYTRAKGRLTIPTEIAVRALTVPVRDIAVSGVKGFSKVVRSLGPKPKAA